jgi:hypothetical protein
MISRQAVTGRYLRIQKLFLYFEVSNANKLSRLRSTFRPDVAVNILRDSDDHPHGATIRARDWTEMAVGQAFAWVQAMSATSSCDQETDKASRDESIWSCLTAAWTRFWFRFFEAHDYHGGADRPPRFPTEHFRNSTADNYA